MRRMAVGFLLFFFVGFVFSQAPGVVLAPAEIVSNLAYVAGDGITRGESMDLVSKEMTKMKQILSDQLSQMKADIDSGKLMRTLKTDLNLQVKEESLKFLKSLKLESATRDAVAFTKSGDELVFGFRGTSQARDLIPDAQLAVNSKKIQRLDEAKEFVEEVMKRNPSVIVRKIHFMGHSLGGFIAEGVRSFFPGSTSTAIHPGTPRLNFKDKVVKAYKPFDSMAEAMSLRVGGGTESPYAGKQIKRVLTEGDLVAGQINNGYARYILYGKKDNGLIDPLPNHKLHKVGQMRSLDDGIGSFVKSPDAIVPKLYNRGPGPNQFDPPGIETGVARSTSQRLRDQWAAKYERAKVAARSMKNKQVRAVVLLAEKASEVAKLQLAAAKSKEALARARVNVRRMKKVLRVALAKQASLVAKGASSAAAKAGKVGARLKNVMKVAGGVGVAVSVLQAGKIATESVQDYHEFKEKLKQGVYDENLSKRLSYAWTDSLLGRGTTEAVVKACSGKGSIGKSSLSCLNGAKNVAKDIGGLVVAGAKSLSAGAGNCLKAGFSKEHECGLKHAPEAIVSGTKKLASAVGGWFSDQYKHHKARSAKKKARRDYCRRNRQKCRDEERIWKENEARARAEYKRKKRQEEGKN